ncbi:MAG TPA: DUF5683 domain-containing protein [Candidatus Acidoferrales bacterium]|nr:DUF5683 domain-containing protein [Candidatus Acidoferrales bacterium]
MPALAAAADSLRAGAADSTHAAPADSAGVRVGGALADTLRAHGVGRIGPLAPGVDTASVATPLVPTAGPGEGRAAPAPPDTTGRGAAEARRRAGRWSEQPRAVMLRSLAVPGWGQFHNHAWIKSAAVAGGEWWIVTSLFQDRHDLDRLYTRANAAADAGDETDYTTLYNQYTAVNNAFVADQWLLGGVLAYALIDAYVDAHFRSFDIEFKTDPALPPGVPTDSGAPAAKPGKGARLSLRWKF